jgi:hypothetical protein
MSEVVNEPPRAHVRIVYLGPVSPHWELYSDYGDRTVLEEFRTRVMARLVTTPRSGATASASCATPSASESRWSGISEYQKATERRPRCPTGFSTES